MCGNTFVKNSEKWRTKRKRQAIEKSYSVNTLTQTGKIYDHVLCALGRKEQFVLSFFLYCAYRIQQRTSSFRITEQGFLIKAVHLVLIGSILASISYHVKNRKLQYKTCSDFVISYCVVLTKW